MQGKREHIDVSVIVLTYFHEKYVRQALDSILTQRTNIRYEVLIGDDASEDMTQDIIREYAERYPDVIVPTLRKENLGATRNSWELLRQAKGKYIANLEGDDYWIDPDKLQKQFDFLENHPEYVGCCGKCLIVDENGMPDYTKTPRFVWNKKIYTIENYFASWQLPGQAGTQMHRNIFRDMRPEEYAVLYKAHRNVGDKTELLLLLSKGPFYCSNEILSCYRQVTSGGHNYFSNHYGNPYRDYDMFMYPCRLEAWAKKNLKLSGHIGPRKDYRFCRFTRGMIKEPSIKKLRYWADMLIHSHEPIHYLGLAAKTLIELE